MTSHLLYIDPGSGSLFYQAILSGILTISVFYKSIKAYLSGMFKKQKEELTNEETTNDAILKEDILKEEIIK